MTDYRWHRPEPRRLVRLGGSLSSARFDGGADLGGSRLEGLGEGGNGGACARGVGGGVCVGVGNQKRGDSVNDKEAAALPWRDITKEWNTALEDYRRLTGKHRHGTLRGSRGPDFPRGMDNKHCAILVVVDRFQGEPIKLHGWGGYPDWWDLTKIIAQPYDAVLRGVKGKTVAVEDRLSAHVQRLVALHNASLAK